MATERNFNAVPPVLLTANGTTEGVLQVQDTAGFYIQMQAQLQNNASAKLTVYIKRVVDSTTLWVGPNKQGLDHNVDVSAFTIATASTISAAEQPKHTVPMEARLLSTYENDPVDAWRIISVDGYGRHYGPANPLPVTIDGTIAIGEVEVVGTNGNTIEPNPDGSLNVVLEGSVIEIGKVDQGLPNTIGNAWPVQNTDGVNSQSFNTDGSVKTVTLFNKPYDTVTATYPTTTQEVYTSRVGGIVGTIVQTVTVTYTDITKNFILNVVRT